MQHVYPAGMTSGPFEPPGGQDTDPDVDTAIHATIGMLRDVVEYFEAENPDNDLRLRVLALRRALIRLRDSRQRNQEGTVA